jgi:hypothetical protein
MDLDASSIIGGLAALPPTQNPYLYLSSEIRQAVAPHHLFFFYPVLYANLSLYLVLFLVSSYCLYDRWRQGSFWLYRIRSTNQGRLIVPNSTTVFCFYSLLTAIFTIITIAIQLAANKGLVSVSLSIYWLSIWLIPIGLAFWSEAHAHACALYLINPNARIRGFRIPAWLINVFFLSHIPLHIGVALAAGALPTEKCSKVYNALYRLIGSIASTATSWQTGQPFQFQPAWLLSVTQVQDDYADMVKTLAVHFKIHLALHLSVATVRAFYFTSSALIEPASGIHSNCGSLSIHPSQAFPKSSSSEEQIARGIQHQRGQAHRHPEDGFIFHGGRDRLGVLVVAHPRRCLCLDRLLYGYHW